MKRKIKSFLKINFLLILLFFSIHGFIPKTKIDKDNTTAKGTEHFYKSDHYLNDKTPIVGFLKVEESDITILSHVKQLSDYAKLPFHVISKETIHTENFEIPKSLRTIFIHQTKPLRTNAIKKLVQFVANGGAIILTTTPEDPRCNYLIGLQKNQALHSYNTSAKGITFCDNFTPGLNGVTLFEENIHYGYNKKSFHKAIRPILYASNEKNYPVILENKIGLGKVIFFNTTFEISKYERGLLFPCLLSTIEGIPYPIANINAIFIDDFPSPVYSFIKEPILSEYNISCQEFVKNVFWPDMITLAKKYNIKYTTTIIFDYSENVEPPYSYTQWNAAREDYIPVSHLITLDVLKEKHELGIHGYNHVSLLKKNWESENIEISFHTVQKIWHMNNYGELPVSYIPPSNYIDKQGVLSLKKGLPSIQYMCSLYTGKLKKGGDREFDPEPYTNTMFDFPRNTSGFYLNNFKKYLKESMYLYTGIWSHFIHPDDVYQIPDKSNLASKGEFSYRNKEELNWKKNNKKNIPGLYYHFEDLLKEHKNNYPLATYPDIRHGGKEVAKLREYGFDHSKSNKFYHVENTKDVNSSQNWFTYVSKIHTKKLVHYLTKNNIPFSKLPIWNGYLINIKTSQGAITIPNFEQKNTYFNTEDVFLTFESYLQHKEPLETPIFEKLKRLRQQLLQQSEISIALWEQYAEYCSWEKQESKFWKDLETLYYKYQNYEVTQLAEKMSKIIWYPKEEDSKIWLERNIINSHKLPDKLALLKRYIKMYSTGNNIENIRTKLKEIVNLHPTTENKIAYAVSYLWGLDDHKTIFLNKLPVEKTYKTIAEEMAWHFYKINNLNKALSWAALSNTISIETQLFWLQEAKMYKELENYFETYTYQSLKEKIQAKKVMVSHYLMQSKLKKSWSIFSTIPDSISEYSKLKKEIRDALLYKNRETQKFLLYETSIADNKLRDSIQRIFMLEEKNTYRLSSNIETNKEDIASFDKVFTYSHIDKKQHAHNFSFTQSLYNNIAAKKWSSIDLYGLNYEFKNSKIFNQKFTYSGKFGLETDRQKYYYTFRLAGSYNLDRQMFSFQYDIAPVRNNVALQQFLYKNTFTFYFERIFKNKMNTSAFLESNYYTDYNKDVTLTLSLSYPIINYHKNTLRIATETALTAGSAQYDGIPYWMVKNRHYAGGGLQYQLNTDIEKTFILLDGMYFYDSYSSYFSRYRARCNFHLEKKLTLNFSGEVYLQNLYYSNALNIGFSYYL